MDVSWSWASPFVPLRGIDTAKINGRDKIFTTDLQCLSALAEYEDWSLEEIRLRDYCSGKHLRPPCCLSNRQVTAFPIPRDESHPFSRDSWAVARSVSEDDASCAGSTESDVGSKVNLFLIKNSKILKADPLFGKSLGTRSGFDPPLGQDLVEAPEDKLPGDDEDVDSNDKDNDEDVDPDDKDDDEDEDHPGDKDYVEEVASDHKDDKKVDSNGKNDDEDEDTDNEDNNSGVVRRSNSCYLDRTSIVYRNTRLMCISGDPRYSDRSLEELRLEDLECSIVKREVETRQKEKFETLTEKMLLMSKRIQASMDLTENITSNMDELAYNQAKMKSIVFKEIEEKERKLDEDESPRTESIHVHSIGVNTSLTFLSWLNTFNKSGGSKFVPSVNGFGPIVTKSSGGLFGSISTTSTAGHSLANATQSSGGMFSSINTTSTEGHLEANTTQSSGGLFISIFTTSIVGHLKANATQSSGGLFSSINTTSTGGHLRANATQSSGGLFSSINTTSTGGHLQANATQSSGGLFGSIYTTSTGGHSLGNATQSSPSVSSCNGQQSGYSVVSSTSETLEPSPTSAAETNGDFPLHFEDSFFEDFP